MLVIEGVIPFVNPAGMRRGLLQVARMEDRSLRLTGLASMLTGVALLYVIR